MDSGTLRKPTSPSKAYAWHRAVMAGKKPQITHDPECGWFVRRLHKGGPLVPARIWWEQPVDPETGELVGDEVMRCEVGGQRRDPVEEWTWLAGSPISQEEYLRLMASDFSGEADDRPAHLPF